MGFDNSFLMIWVKTILCLNMWSTNHYTSAFFLRISTHTTQNTVGRSSHHLSSQQSSKPLKTTRCSAKLNKIASSFDLDEIFANEQFFLTSDDGETSSSNRGRTPFKDKKQKKLKEVLKEQKSIKFGSKNQTLNQETDDFDELELEETILHELEFEVHEIESSDNGKRVDAVLVQKLNADIGNNDVAISRSQCGILLTNNCVFIITPEHAPEFIQSHQDELSDSKTTLSYCDFQSLSVPINRKSFQLEESSFLIFPSRKSLVSPANSGTLLSNVPPKEIIPQNLPLDIIYEDECMIVINKEAGMVVHPAAGNWDGTVVNALSYYLLYSSPFGSGEFFDVIENKGIEDFDEEDDSRSGIEINRNNAVTNSISTLRPGIVHRLDKGTTGVLIVAKSREALASLSEAFAQRRVNKQYLAVTVGNPGDDVRIDKPIGRHPLNRQKMRVVPDPSASILKQNRLTGSRSPSSSKQGRSAMSHVHTVCHDGKLSIVRVRIATGRTHQIRVHLQDHGTPIYGDDVYGLSDWNRALSTKRGIARPLLHARRLEINHPISGERMVFEANIANDMMAVMKSITPAGEDLDDILCR